MIASRRALEAEANWREANVDGLACWLRPVVKRYGCGAITQTVQNEHPITPYDVRLDTLLRKKAFAERLASNVNWCPTCKQYVKWSHDGPGGIDCEIRLATVAEKRAVKFTNHGKKEERRRVVCRQNTYSLGAVVRLVSTVKKTLWHRYECSVTPEKRKQMVAQGHRNAPPRVRSLEKIVSESRYFPI